MGRDRPLPLPLLPPHRGTDVRGLGAAAGVRAGVPAGVPALPGAGVPSGPRRGLLRPHLRGEAAAAAAGGAGAAGGPAGRRPRPAGPRAAGPPRPGAGAAGPGRRLPGAGAGGRQPLPLPLAQGVRHRPDLLRRVRALAAPGAPRSRLGADLRPAGLRTARPAPPDPLPAAPGARAGRRRLRLLRLSAGVRDPGGGGAAAAAGTDARRGPAGGTLAGRGRGGLRGDAAAAGDAARGGRRLRRGSLPGDAGQARGRGGRGRGPPGAVEGPWQPAGRWGHAREELGLLRRWRAWAGAGALHGQPRPGRLFHLLLLSPLAGAGAGPGRQHALRPSCGEQKPPGTGGAPGFAPLRPPGSPRAALLTSCTPACAGARCPPTAAPPASSSTPAPCAAGQACRNRHRGQELRSERQQRLWLQRTEVDMLLADGSGPWS
ncbi:uncharacterized protein M6G45_009300 [Spheniscus humboldti]